MQNGTRIDVVNTGTKPAEPTERAQIAAQVDYYRRRQPVRMLPVDTPYVRRHFDEAARAIDLRSDDAVCEWGSGMGRFSRLFVERGCALTAVELSPQLAAVGREAVADQPGARVEVGDILEIAARLDAHYTVVAGFFMLHHLGSVAPYLAAARRILKPGGRFVFVEPNPLNPLYAVQITCTRGMRWHEESGVYRMWPRTIARAAESAGFCDFQVHRYGALPRLPYNVAARLRMERWPEYVTPAPLRPFQVFSARLPRA